MLCNLVLLLQVLFSGFFFTWTSKTAGRYSLLPLLPSRGQKRLPERGLNLSVLLCRAKVFRGKKILGEYDIKVEQVNKSTPILLSCRVEETFWNALEPPEEA